MNKQDNELIEAYRTYYGKSYFVKLISYSSLTGGDYKSINFEIFSEKEKITDIEIRVSGTLIAIWGLNIGEIEENITALSILKIRAMAENEEISEGKIDISFSTFDIDHNFKKAVKDIEDTIDYYRERNMLRIEDVKSSYLEKAELSKSMARDNLEIQQGHSREIRSIIVQIVSLSGVIIGAMLTLGEEASSSPFYFLTIILFLFVMLIGLFPTLETLEDGIIKTNKWYIKFSRLLDKTRFEESKFLTEPTVSGYNEVKKQWEKDVIFLKENQNPLDIQKDKNIFVMKIIFFLAIISLVASFINFNTIYDMLIKFYSFIK